MLINVIVLPIEKPKCAFTLALLSKSENLLYMYAYKVKLCTLTTTLHMKQIMNVVNWK